MDQPPKDKSTLASPDQPDEDVELTANVAMGPDDTREGMGRLVDFVERYLRERTAKANPELRKRSTAISAYQKIKKA